MLSTVLYYELAMKVPIPVGITVYLLTWGLGHLRCLVVFVLGLHYFSRVNCLSISRVICGSINMSFVLSKFYFYISSKSRNLLIYKYIINIQIYTRSVKRT